MAKSTNKTAPTDASVTDFLNAVEPEKRRRDGFRALEIMKRVTGLEPVMWGPSIIGFGSYHYKYESGREGDMIAVGFSPRKANMVFYIIHGFGNYEEQLSRLGKYKHGKSCLYITDLDKVDLDVLEEICESSYKYVQEKYNSSGGSA